MRRPILFSIIILVIFFAIAFYIFPMMPERVASHWNSEGQVDGYMGKFWGVFFVPILSLGMFIIFLLVPIIDPLKRNIQKFKEKYEYFVLMLLTFMLYVFILTMLWNLNFQINMVRMLLPAFGILFFYMGMLMENTEQNWFIGIRNPWTLSSKTVWKKTHHLAALLFKISGLLAVAGLLFNKYQIWIVIGPVIISSIAVMVYSYVIYRKEKHK